MHKNSLWTGLLCVPRKIVVCYYKKFFYLWRENELFEINFEFKWRSQPLRDPQQITFIMLNRFWSLSKKPFTSPSSPPRVLKGQYQTWWNANQRHFWEGTSVRSYKIQLPVFLFLVLLHFLYPQFENINKLTSSEGRINFFTSFTSSPHQTGVNHILKSSPSCQNSCFFSRIFTL